MQKSILIILGIAALFALLFALGSQNPGSVPGGDALTAASALSVSEDSYDFGEISMKDGLVRRSFTVTNNASSTPLILSRISTSCMCTEAFLESNGEKLGPFGMPGHGGATRSIREEILAGESRAVEVVFDPAAHGPAGVGRITRAVFIEDEAGGVATLEISATVTP